MKRNLTNLKRKHYRAMKRWMGKKDAFSALHCPWESMYWYGGCIGVGEKLCKGIFPKLGTNGTGAYICPSNAYSYKYVRKVIRGILKNREE